MRFVAYLAIAACVAQFPATGLTAVTRAVTSEEQACELLKRAAVEFHLSTHNLAGRYFCEPLPEHPTYYLLGLRYRVTANELVGSNLIGWFAVAKSDGRVLDWDIAEDRAAPLAPRPPFEDE